MKNKVYKLKYSEYMGASIMVNVAFIYGHITYTNPITGTVKISYIYNYFICDIR